MNIKQFTKFASVLAIVALIVGLSLYNQIGQPLMAAPPGRCRARDSHWGCYSSDRTIRFPVWSVNAKWL